MFRYRLSSRLVEPPARLFRGPLWGATLLAVASALAGPSRAAEALDAQNAPVAVGTGPLAVQIAVETLAIEPGPGAQATRNWVPAGRLRAGDEVHYTIRVSNPGRKPVSNIVVTKRLPFGVHYVRGSAVGPACTVQFSIDGGATFARPTPLTAAPVRKRTSRKTGSADYTHVRWIFGYPLSPNATALLRFRATFS